MVSGACYWPGLPSERRAHEQGCGKEQDPAPKPPVASRSSPSVQTATKAPVFPTMPMSAIRAAEAWSDTPLTGIVQNTLSAA